MSFIKREKFLPYALPLFDDSEIKEVVDTIKSNWVSRGPKTQEFEKKFAEFIGVRHAVAMNSCTAALHTTLAAWEVGSGDEVITTPLTFAATANTIIHTGAVPVFVDVDPSTFNIDAARIEEKITDKAKVILPVHYSGQPCEMDRINELAQKYKLMVLEDAAHSVYAQYKGKMVGSLGNAAAFSFYATKNLSTGEGGMLTTNDSEMAEKARIISLHGMSKNAWNRYGKGGSWYYEVLYPGFKYNMTDIQASLGLHQLLKLESMQKTREYYASIYDEAFSGMEELTRPQVIPGVRHSWHLYVICINTQRLSIDRDEFIRQLTDLNIGTSVHFIPVHLHPCYRKNFGFKEGDFPVSEDIYRRIISLPLYPAMSEKEVRYVVDGVKNIIERYRK